MYFWLGINKPGVGLESANFGERTDVAGNHSPYFYVDDSALDEGVKAFVYLIDDYPTKFLKKSNLLRSLNWLYINILKIIFLYQLLAHHFFWSLVQTW